MYRLVGLLLLGSTGLFAGTLSTDQLIDQVQKRYNSAKTLSVRFVERYEIAGHQRRPEAGLLTLRKQGKMRWDYSEPEGKLLVCDGKEILLYTAEDNRVEKVPFKDTEDMRAPLAFLLGRLDMRKAFRDFRAQPAADGTWLDASAKSDRTPYKEVDMLITADGAIRGLRVLGRDESTMNFALSDEKLNPAVPDAYFHFSVPAGAEVVDALAIQNGEK